MKQSNRLNFVAVSIHNVLNIFYLENLILGRFTTNWRFCLEYATESQYKYQKRD